MSSEDLEEEALEESVLTLSSLLFDLDIELILTGLVPVAACVWSCRMEGVEEDMVYRAAR